MGGKSEEYIRDRSPDKRMLPRARESRSSLGPGKEAEMARSGGLERNGIFAAVLTVSPTGLKQTCNLQFCKAITSVIL